MVNVWLVRIGDIIDTEDGAFQVEGFNHNEVWGYLSSYNEETGDEDITDDYMSLGDYKQHVYKNYGVVPEKVVFDFPEDEEEEQ